MKKSFILTAIFVLSAVFSVPVLAQGALSGTWDLTKIVKDGVDVPLVSGGKAPTIIFGDNNSVSGNGSCNGYGGKYTLSGGSEIKFGPIHSTRIGCMGGINGQESTFLNILQGAAIYKTDEGIMHLADADSKNILTFKLKQALPETMTHLWIVNNKRVDCQGFAANQKCLQVKKTDAAPWENFYGTIAGFNYKPGRIYLIRVTAMKEKVVAADGSAYDYKLVKVISRTKLMPHVD
jgi:heat shock protein HslJ